MFPTFWKFSRNSRISRISTKRTFLKRPLFQKTPFLNPIFCFAEEKLRGQDCKRKRREGLSEPFHTVVTPPMCEVMFDFVKLGIYVLTSFEPTSFVAHSTAISDTISAIPASSSRPFRRELVCDTSRSEEEESVHHGMLRGIAQ